jgi:hypothetical protein
MPQKTKTPNNELIPHYQQIKKQLLQFLAEDTLALEYYKIKEVTDATLEDRIKTNIELLNILNKLISA